MTPGALADGGDPPHKRSQTHPSGRSASETLGKRCISSQASNISEASISIAHLPCPHCAQRELAHRHPICRYRRPHTQRSTVAYRSAPHAGGFISMAASTPSSMWPSDAIWAFDWQSSRVSIPPAAPDSAPTTGMAKHAPGWLYALIPEWGTAAHIKLGRYLRPPSTRKSVPSRKRGRGC